MSGFIRAFGSRLLLVALLLGAYVLVWRPYGRSAYIRGLAAPALRSVDAVSASHWSVDVPPGGRRLVLRSADGPRSFGLTAPAGVRFLLPALGLLLLAPWRPYWLVLWGGHLVLGLLGLGFLILGLSYSAIGFSLYDVVTSYLVDAFSLGTAVLAVHLELGLGAPVVES